MADCRCPFPNHKCADPGKVCQPLDDKLFNVTKLNEVKNFAREASGPTMNFCCPKRKETSEGGEEESEETPKNELKPRPQKSADDTKEKPHPSTKTGGAGGTENIAAALDNHREDAVKPLPSGSSSTRRSKNKQKKRPSSLSSSSSSSSSADRSIENARQWEEGQQQLQRQLLNGQ
jgi:hypothetical protein